MRRLGFALLALTLGPGSPAVSQTPHVGLVAGLWSKPEPNGARRAMVQVQDLLNDPSWLQALEQAFPIRLTFRLEIWHSRQGWIDEFQRATEWTTVIQKELLEDQYRVTRILAASPEEFRFSTRDELDRWIKQVNLVDALPQGTGTFYYSVSLRITALTDDQMDELERFLSGQSEPPSDQPPGSLARRVRRFLLRLAGLPEEFLEARTAKFTVERGK
jgi:Domain of unknown function (DUF4390)